MFRLVSRLLPSISLSCCLLATSSAAAGSDFSFSEIEASAAERPRVESIALIEQWAARHPNDPESARAWLTAADLLIMESDFARARLAVTKAAASDGIWRRRADNRMVELDLIERKLKSAVKRLEAMVRSSDPETASYASSMLPHAISLQRQAWAGLALGAAVLLEVMIFSIAAGLRRGVAAFWPIPLAVKIYFPVALMLLLSGTKLRDPEMFLALGITAVGGLLTIAAYGAFFRAFAFSRTAKIAFSLLALLTSTALIYSGLLYFGRAGDPLID